MFADIATTDLSRFEPVGVFRLFGQPLPPVLIHDFVVATLAANILFLFGWMYRIVAPIFAMLVLVLICYRNSWSMVYHSQNVAVLHVIILAMLPAADAISIDAWVEKRSGNERLPSQQRAWCYGWGLWLMSVVAVITYVLAGIAKVSGSLGWSWVHGTSLRNQIAVDALRKELLGHSAPDLAFLLYDQVWLFTLLGVFSLILEFGAVFAIANRRLGQIWAILTFGMHWGIFFIMGITFRYHLSGIIFATFFSWERLLPRAWRTVTISQSDTVGYEPAANPFDSADQNDATIPDPRPQAIDFSKRQRSRRRKRKQ